MKEFESLAVWDSTMCYEIYSLQLQDDARGTVYRYVKSLNIFGVVVHEDIVGLVILAKLTLLVTTKITYIFSSHIMGCQMIVQTLITFSASIR